MEFKPTEEQQIIFDTVKNEDCNILVQAYAGAGKTSTIVEAIKYLPENKSKMFLAFNKHIQEELKTKLPDDVRCMTTYGIGLSALKRKYKDIVFDEHKIDKLIKKKQNSWKLQNELKQDEIDNYYKSIKKTVDMCRLTYTIDVKYIPTICERYDVKYSGVKDIKRIASILSDCIDDKKTYDYIDMIFIPAVDNKVWLFPQDIIAVDECQDLSRTQIELIKKMFKKDKITNEILTRLIVIGDVHQCQPEGTLVLMSDKTYKKIEDVKIGDSVVSYDRSEKGCYVGVTTDKQNIIYKNRNIDACFIKNTSKNIFNGELIVIESSNKISKYTPNHRCFIRMRKDSVTSHVLYLMEKNGFFRIGISPLWSENKPNFGTNRALGEDADKFWVLNTYENKFNAYLDEQYYSLVHSIPQMTFLHIDQKGNISQEIIDKFYNRFNKDELKERSCNLLNKFKRKYEHPLWEKHVVSYFSKNNMYEIRACNIIKDIMEVVHYNDESKYIRTHGKNGTSQMIYKAVYKNIDEIYYEKYNGFIYSLSVGKYEAYVADGMLTHNSIYSFAGSDDRNFDYFKNIPNTKELTLSTTFRCAKNIVKKAQEIVPNIMAMDNAIDGIVREGNVLEEAKAGDFILCRTTAPLVKLFFYFLLKHKKAIIKGSDIGVSLIEMIGNFKSMDELKKHWQKKLSDYQNQLTSKGVINLDTNGGYIALKDKINTLMFLIRIAPTVPDLKTKITQIFGDVDKEGITLMTCHKSKGLESDRVFIVRHDLLPMRSSSPLQYKQEKNLQYVSYTRAKQELIVDYEWNDEK